MKIAIVHYHLNRGGVTKVIENHLLALDAVLPPERVLPVAVLHGGRQLGWPQDLPERLGNVRLTLRRVPSLDYDDQQPAGSAPPHALADDLVAALDDLEFGPQETVLHVHNHAVGKNVSLPRALWAVAERGYAALLHVHDFVEDFRPAGFHALAAATAGDSRAQWHGTLYPQAPHLHYAVLTERDRAVLEVAGTDCARLHLVPNPVPDLAIEAPRPQARQRLSERFGVAADARFVLYPVRCIRRKNVGEALLCSRLAPPGTVVGFTLPPLNRAVRPIYERWKEFSRGLDLPCRFDVGADDALSFAENVAASDLILTTSVAEGFGMAFLESWLAGRFLVGRDLPEVTSDFRRSGVRLDGLQARLEIPAEWVGTGQLRHAIREAFRVNLALYGRPQPVSLSDALDAKTGGPTIDFGDLDEPFQEQVIGRACASPQARQELLERNPWIEPSFSADAAQSREAIRHNVEAIRRHYSLVRAGERLLKAYDRAISSPRTTPPEPLAHPERILDRFLDLSRFRLIRNDQP